MHQKGIRQGARGRVAVLVFAGAIAIAPAPASASSIDVPQNILLGNNGNLSHMGQTFTVPAAPVTDNFLHTLTLSNVEWSSGGTATSFKIYITTAAGDVPSVPASGPYLFESAPIPVPRTGPVTVHPNLTVTPGSQYAVFIDIESPRPLIGANNTDPLAGGTAVSFNTTTNTWGVLTPRDLAFSADFNSGKTDTNTAVNCSPQTVPASATSNCTVTVTNAGTFATQPSGNVTMQTPGGGIAQCTLSAGSCTIPVIMSSGEGNFSAVANYAGDTTHLASTSPGFTITATRRTTSTSVSCSPGTIKLGEASTCTITVEDTQAEGIPPPLSGTNVALTGPGLSSNVCTLSQSASRVGTCSVQSAPILPGSQTVGADVFQNSYLATSHGETTLVVNKRASTTTLTCLPAAPPPGQSSTCTVEVKDLDTGTQTQPTGTVALTKTGNGTLGATSCNLGAAGTCDVLYTPAAAGSSTVTASYGGDAIHDGASANSNVAGSSLPAPPANPQSAAQEPPETCADATQKLKRLKKKLKRQRAGAGDSTKKAKKRAKIRKNIKKTKRRKGMAGC